MARRGCLGAEAQNGELRCNYADQEDWIQISTGGGGAVV